MKLPETERQSYWIMRAFRWLLGENVAQWICMAVVIYFSCCISISGHGFDLLIFWIAGNLRTFFHTNDTA